MDAKFALKLLKVRIIFFLFLELINFCFLVPEINRDPNSKIIQWHTQSTKSFSTVGTYAKYQVQSYMATKDRKRKYEYDENVVEMNKMIKFGTNVDLR